MAASGFEQVSRTHVGCRRSLNEDAVLARADRGLWAVADGMGGHESGEVASAMVVEALSRCPPGPSGLADAADALAALHDVNLRLVELGRDRSGGGTIGSTVVGLAAGNGRFTCFWAGDSRAYLVRDGRISRLSHDHSLVQELVDAGMLDERQAEAHPNANVITRAVGVSETLEVDTVDGEVRAGDVFLLASDGLTRLLGDDELLARLRTADLDSAADGLLRTALEREAPDNVSLVVVRAP